MYIVLQYFLEHLLNVFAKGIRLSNQNLSINLTKYTTTNNSNTFLYITCDSTLQYTAQHLDVFHSSIIHTWNMKETSGVSNCGWTRMMPEITAVSLQRVSGREQLMTARHSQVTLTAQRGRHI